MLSFQFRLRRVLEWYRKRCDLEESRLKLCMGWVSGAAAELEHHRKDTIARQKEIVEAPFIQVQELVALGLFRRRAQQQEIQLNRKLQKAEQDLERQRGVALSAQRRLRLIEKLRDRRAAEYQYEAERSLEEAASESHLAAFARNLQQKQ